MSEITIQTGLPDDTHQIHVQWFDHNGVRYSTDIVVAVEPMDKPRTLTICIDGKVVYSRSDEGTVYA